MTNRLSDRRHSIPHPGIARQGCPATRVLHSNALELREDELDFVSGGIDSKFDQLESSVDCKQAGLVQRLEPSP